MSDETTEFSKMECAELAVPLRRVPVFAVVDGVRVKVAEGWINPEDNFLFTARFDETSIAQSALEEFKKIGEGAGLVRVSEFTFQHEVTTTNNKEA